MRDLWDHCKCKSKIHRFACRLRVSNLSKCRDKQMCTDEFLVEIRIQKIC